VSVTAVGREPGLTPSVVRRVVAAVLDAEGAAGTPVSVTFLPAGRMRALNRRAFGRDRATDVIAFALPHDGVLTGDVYVCPAMAKAAARTLDIPVREELVRLVVHGVLHVLGHNHPESAARTASPMWRRQERYVRRLTRGAR
jgi:probable rRNA maturation factor